MNLREIQDQQLMEVHDSGVQVVTVPIYGHVTIRDEEGRELFLQGAEGYEFISAARRLWGTSGDLTTDQCNEIMAYDYLYELAEAEPTFTCDGCGREELNCSHDPCADVIADRKAPVKLTHSAFIENAYQY